jgi:hypothetical protein
MVELKVPEKKLLSEECWIELGDGLRFRIEYPSEGRKTEFQRLWLLWYNGKADGRTEHWAAYYIRSTVKEVDGLTIEGESAKLMFDSDLATEFSNGKSSLDFITTLNEWRLVFVLAGMIMEHLGMTEIDKKKFPSLPISSSEDNSTTHTSNSSPEPASSTVGTQSIPAVGSVS